MDAIEKYDPDKNCKFKTYAEFRIKGAILDQLRSLDWVPRSVRQKSRKLEKRLRRGRAAPGPGRPPKTRSLIRSASRSGSSTAS